MRCPLVYFIAKRTSTSRLIITGVTVTGTSPTSATLLLPVIPAPPSHFTSANSPLPSSNATAYFASPSNAPKLIKTELVLSNGALSGSHSSHRTEVSVQAAFNPETLKAAAADGTSRQQPDSPHSSEPDSSTTGT
jgi:hypothetical protein